MYADACYFLIGRKLDINAHALVWGALGINSSTIIINDSFCLCEPQSVSADTVRTLEIQFKIWLVSDVSNPIPLSFNTIKISEPIFDIVIRRMPVRCIYLIELSIMFRNRIRIREGAALYIDCCWKKQFVFGY